MARVRQTKRRTFLVSLDIPPGASIARTQDYILDAVRAWAGSLFPGNEEFAGDPLFNLDRDSVEVTPLPGVLK